MHLTTRRSGKPGIFIVEEHHEAYYVWKYAIHHGMIKKERHTLLHIDEHSDMGTPILDFPLRRLNGDMRHIRDFTYQELGIATFIIPAIYEGIIDKVYWIKQYHTHTNRASLKMYVRSQDEEGRLLAMGRVAQLERFDDEAHTKSKYAKYYKMYKQHIDQMGRLEKVLLDIDLDYFSCIQNPLKKELRVEITRDEYEEFRKSPYHRIRFFDFGRVEVLADEGRYYYRLNGIGDPDESPIKVNSATIKKRVGEMARHLQASHIRPELITICRSQISGYTPADQWELIENELLKALNDIFDLEKCVHVGQIV
jgi:hypothetical protein